MAADPFPGLSRMDLMTQLVKHEGLRLLKDRAGPVIERAFAADPAGTGSL